MKYNELIGVNENFQYSVNLQFDINNISKIREYIPTRDGCELLKKYIDSVLNGKNKATTLIGPYGKGKSHLLLVLITLLNDYFENDCQYINEFIEKIKSIDTNLYNDLNRIRKEKIRLMPIIINSNYSDLNQAFLLALSESLERENLSDIVINTYFDVAIKVIEKWENNYKDFIVEIKKCLKNYDCTLKELKQGLRKYSDKYYEIFRNVYSCMLHGQEFNPLVNSDIIKIYKDMTHELKNYNFNGMFIVFDEFSKFLEYVDNNRMTKDLKLLQDFAELANRTGKEEQIHLCCITHKAMNQYAKNMDEDKANAFKTVEGRFKELYFNRSLEQNYEIVSYALKKKKGFNEFFSNYINENSNLYNLFKENLLFKETDNVEKILFEGCFPLNPITVYSLIELSEKIAQNERTLFTFLTDDDSNSLKNFILNNENGLFNIDKIYDYFKPILKKDDTDNIKTIWIKSENALMKVKEQNEQKILKALAIIYMINETEILIPDDITLMSSLALTKQDYDNAVNSLIEKSIIKRKKITDEIDFATIYNHEISREIKRLSETQFYEINIKDTLSEIININYSLPRRYNEEFKMTRFFANIFMNENDLLAFNKFDVLFENYYCDGIIINLIRDSRNIQTIRDDIKNINSDRVIVKIPKTIFPKTIISLLREYKSIEYLLNNSNNDKEVNDELELIQKENIEIIDEQIQSYFAEDNIQEFLYKEQIEKKVMNLSAYLSDICSKIYYKTPIINNEMINKRTLSAPIKKARDIVIETILNDDKSLIKSKTSAEATIYKAIVEKKNMDSISKVLSDINNFIADSENKKISFEKIYKKLENPPYSIRKGIIPVLIAMALYNYSDIIIVYFMNKEIELNAINLIKINDNPEKYFILTEKGTADKIKYLSNLMYIYDVPNLETQRINLKKLVETMRRWILSLPRILREYNNEVQQLKIKKEYLYIKMELLKPDINNNELIYQNVPAIFNSSNYPAIIDEIKNMKNLFDDFISKYSEILINETIGIIKPGFKGSITSMLKEWYDDNKLDKSNIVYNLNCREFIDYIKNISTHDDKDVIEKLAKIITGYYIEDWQPAEYQNYINGLNNIVKTIKSPSKNISDTNRITLIDGDNRFEKYITSSDNISAIGNTLKNNIEEVINEYGDSLTEQEKVSILLNIVKKYM